jgi:hypothetical protein
MRSPGICAGASPLIAPSSPLGQSGCIIATNALPPHSTSGSFANETVGAHRHELCQILHCESLIAPGDWAFPGHKLLAGIPSRDSMTWPHWRSFRSDFQQREPVARQSCSELPTFRDGWSRRRDAIPQRARSSIRSALSFDEAQCRNVRRSRWIRSRSAPPHTRSRLDRSRQPSDAPKLLCSLPMSSLNCGLN